MNNPQKEQSIWKKPCIIVKNGDTDDRKAKEQARAEKANKRTDSTSANCSEDNPSRKEQEDTKETVKMSRLCKAGLFFLRWVTADPSPWGNFTPPTKH